MALQVRRNHRQTVFPALRDGRTQVVQILFRRVPLDRTHVEGMPRGEGVRQDRLGHANIQNTMVYMRYTTVTRDTQTRQLFASHLVV